MRRTETTPVTYMSQKYKIIIIEAYAFSSKEDADAFADFKRESEADNPECTKVEVTKLYQKTP
jgi:hypothetical protein